VQNGQPLPFVAPWNAATSPIQSLFCRIDKGILFDDTIPKSTYVREIVDIICKNTGLTPHSKLGNV
jgi:hypothetical protein